MTLAVPTQPWEVPGATGILSEVAAGTSPITIQSLIDAKDPALGGSGVLDLRLGPGVFDFTGRPLTLFPNATGINVEGRGRGVTTIVGERGFDPDRRNDNDTFQNIEIHALTMDRNNIPAPTNTHVLFGSLLGGRWLQRVNFDTIHIHNFDVINSVANCQNVSIGCTHLTSGEGTTNTLTNITIEDFHMEGGDYGWVVIGNADAITAGQGVEVFYDNITVRDGTWDRGATPTGDAVLGAAGQVGGYAYGGRVYCYNVHGANSRDVGIEIDNAVYALIDPACTMRDCWVLPYLFRNFRKPGTGTNPYLHQLNECFGTSIFENVNPGSGGNTGSCYGIQGDAATAGYIFGTARFLGRAILECSLANLSTGGLVVQAQNVQFNRVEVDLSVDIRNLNINVATTQNAVFISLHSLLSGHSTDVKVNWRLAGARAGAGVISWKMVRLTGVNPTHNFRGQTVDIAGLAGLSANDTFYWVMIGSEATLTTSNLRASIRGIRFLNTPVGGTHQGVYVGTTVTTGLLGVTIDENDMAMLVGRSGFDYNIDPGNAPLVKVPGFLATSSRAGGVTNAVASAAALTLPAAGTDINVTGVTNITSIAASWKGRTVYLRFSGVLTLTDGSNLKLGGNIVTAADMVVPLICDGTNWYQLAPQSAN